MPEDIAWRKNFNKHGKKYRQRYPERIRAKKRVAYAIRTGKLKRKPCRVCGDPKSEAHHPDYNQPLKVVFFCRKHHEMEHHKRAAR